VSVGRVGSTASPNSSLRYTEVSCSWTPITTILTINRWRESAGCTLEAVLTSKIAEARRNRRAFSLSEERHRERVMSVQLDFQKQDGLITAVVQDATTQRVLMVGYMNEEAFNKTITTGHVTFFSRSRQKLWTKGESSGHYLTLKSIATDCDADALLVQAEPIGPGVCHEGYESCSYRTLQNGDWVETEQRAYDPNTVYGAK
jgi:phosphoribosyl-AMP cyclohydrolase